MALTQNLPAEKLRLSLPVFYQHFLRARWQYGIWTKAREEIPESANGETESAGWKKKEGKIIPVYFQGISAIDMMRKYFCECGKKKCNPVKCNCQLFKLKCSNICLSAESCTNKI